MAQKILLVANWKMHPATRSEAKLLFASIKRVMAKRTGVSLIVAPPSLYLSELVRSYKGSAIAFAAQHGHEGSVGAHTGEISMYQIKDSGAKYVLVGHAERRKAGESDEDTNKQILSAFEAGLVPILCIGEDTRSVHGEHLSKIKQQLRVALAEISEQYLQKIIIAYEPVWAIGAPEPMSPRQMHEMVIFIRKLLVEMRGQVGYAIKILYGGAIDEASGQKMISEADVHGLLVGRASNDASEFASLINSISVSS